MMFQQLETEHRLLHRLIELVCFLALIAAITDLFAAEPPRFTETQRLTDEARKFLNQEVAGLGEVHVQVTAPDTLSEIPLCDRIEAFLPPGARAQGKTTVGVRCITPNRWTVFLQAQIQILTPYLVAAHPLSAGQILSPNDFTLKLMDISDTQTGIINVPEALYGNTLLTNIPTGNPIRRQQIKLAFVVQSGQPVKLRMSGQGFQITGEGIALANASEGQAVQVRTPRGTLVSGVARSGGLVELKL
jgi:flagellar basal body P-ring formation protein FlgA